MLKEIRRSANPAPVTLRPAEKRGLAVVKCNLHVITPVFGGGVHVENDELRRHDKQPDRLTPLRSAAIRGQLRFWWRAVHAASFTTLSQLWDAERSLWGAASEPGACSLDVSHDAVEPKPVEVFEMRQGNNGYWNPRSRSGMENIAYGAFPLQPKAGQAERLDPGRLYRLGVEFQVRLTAPADRAREVEAAMRAWSLFGGIGGRTRRGFGSLEPTSAAGIRAARDLLASVPTGAAVNGVPSLAGARFVAGGRQYRTADDALSAGLGALRGFRQGVNFGRNPGQSPNRPGRSRWPEAEAIRKITGRSDPQHRERFVRVDKFPRAAFGMPIIFHFQSRQDPSDTQLKPRDSERFASPLLLRPMRDDQGRYVATALVLAGTLGALRAVELSGTSVSAMLEPPEAQGIRPLAGRADPLIAFLDYFETHS